MTERFDVVVIGGGGTGSEVAYQLARRSDLRVALAERDRLGGECTNDGCVPTKVMLRSAKVAQTARDAERFGVRVPDVEVDFGAVQQRARDVVDHQTRDGPEPFERLGVTVFLQQARLVGERRVELADGTEIETGHVVLATGTAPTLPPVAGIAEDP
jgi:pyruvate/2-oxoglutarate dehydrogenase complex dihydrolipoamide dehydrogenase (E3) component